MRKKTIFVFHPYCNDIYSDEKGNFYTIKNSVPIKKRSYNGCLCIQFNGKRYGLGKLLKNAIKTEAEMEETLPF